MAECWKTVPLGEVLVERKDHPCAADMASGAIPVVAKIAFADGAIQMRSVGETKTGMILVRPGDLLVSGINAAKGAISIYDPADRRPAAATIHYGAYSAREGIADVRFLWWLLRSNSFRGVLDQHLPGGIKTELKAKRLLAVPISLPPISEQRRIVARIELISEKIKAASRFLRGAIAEVSALESAFLSRLVRPAPPGGLLGDWLAHPPRNGWSPRCNNAEGGVAVLGLGAITGFAYRPDQIKRTTEPVKAGAHYWLRPGELLMSRSNTPELVGHAAIYNGDPHPCIYSDLMMRLTVNPEKAEIRFVHLWLKTSAAREFVRSNAKGTSPTMKKISQGTVMNVPVPRLPLAEQRRIVDSLDAFLIKAEPLKKRHQEIAAELDALLPSILDRAFRGELLPDIGPPKITISATLAAKKLAVTAAPATARPAKKPTPFKDDAAVLCVLTEELLKLQRPTDEFCVQKHAYLGHEHWKLPINSTFKREAAGPWSQQLTHKAIYAAIQQNWLRWADGQLVPGRSFQRGLAHAATLSDDARPKAQKTASDLSKFGDHGLERWATVLMAVRDLQAAGNPVCHVAIQKEIDRWPGKRAKEIFTEESVGKTIDAMVRQGWFRIAESGRDLPVTARDPAGGSS